MTLQRGQFAPTPKVRLGNSIPAGPSSAGAPLPAGNDDKPLVRLNLLRALQLHRGLALGIAIAGIVLALAYVIKTWPVYTAQSQLYIQPIQSKLIPEGNEQYEPINSAAYDSFLEQQLQSASNPEVLLSALHKLPPGAWQRNGESEQAASERLGRAIEVERVGTSYEVVITAKARDPQLAAKIANAVASSIVDRAAGEGNAGDEQRISLLREERDRVQNELNADYTEQDSLNKQLGMAAVGTAAPDLIDYDIGKTREELIKAQTEHHQAEVRYAAMKAGQGTSSSAIDAEADDIVAADAGLASMKQSLNQRRAVLITQMANLTPNNPQYKQDADELTKINSNLDSMMKDLRATAVQRIQQKLRTELERTVRVEAQLNGQLRQLAGTAASAGPELQRASDLANDIVRLRARYTIVDEQLHNVMLQDSVPGAVHLSVVAVAPLHPAVSGILKKALPLAFGGLFLGLLVASVINYLDPKIYIAADIEQALGFAPMAVLPDFDEVSDEAASDQLLRLSSTIEHARQHGDLKNCIFTGTAAGTGVTTVATRVRDVLEAMGRPTVLLDASGTPLPPAYGGAKGKPATQRGSRSTALLQQVKAETQMRQENLVLTDTAPLLISAETEYLARFVDSAIVVAESGVTTRPQLLAAVSALQRLGVGTVGLVLNRVKLAKADPAFRRSIHDIETHLQSQSMSASGRAVRTNYPAPEPLPETRELPCETAAVPHAAPVAPEPKPAPKVAAVEAKQPTPQTPVPAPSRVTAPSQSPEESSVPNGEPDPWWLAEANPQHNEVHWQPLAPRKQTAPAPSPSPVVEPAKPQVLSWESLAKPAASAPDIAIPAAQAEPDGLKPISAAPSEYTHEFKHWTAPVCAVETPRGSAALKSSPEIAKREAAPVAAPQAVPEEVPKPDRNENVNQTEPQSESLPESRLNGLRGMLFSLGLKNLGKARGSASDYDDPSLPPESDPEPTILAHSFTPFPEPAPAVDTPPSPKASNVSVKPVIAQPEFLPPQEFVPVKDKEPVRETGSTAHNDRGESDDEVQILPSRRGQYWTRG